MKYRKLINLYYPIIVFYFHSSKFIKTILVFRNSSNAAFVRSSFPTMDFGKLLRHLNNWKFVNIRYSSSNPSSFRMYSLHMVYIFDIWDIILLYDRDGTLFYDFVYSIYLYFMYFFTNMCPWQLWETNVATYHKI